MATLHQYGCTHSTQANPEVSTPMVRQFLAVKQQYEGVLLLYQMGDFYETFFEDALIAHRVLEITLTARDAGGLGKIPMAGIPIKAADSYLPKLLSNGLQVAIAEQAELSGDDAQKGLVQRSVVRVLSSGTVTDGPMLPVDAANFLVALVPHPKQSDQFGLAWCDVSTGQFFAATCPKFQLVAELHRLNPSELLVPGKWQTDHASGVKQLVPLDNVPTLDWSVKPVMASSQAPQLVCQVLGIHSLDSVGLQADQPTTWAAGLIAQTLKHQFPQQLPNLDGLQVVQLSQTVYLPANTRRNLELFETARHGQVQGSLFATLNQCQTGMGARLLRHWLGQPVTNRFELDARLSSVEALVNHPDVLQTIRDYLAEFSDLERLAQKVAQGNAMPRDLMALANSLNLLPPVMAALTPLIDVSGPDAFYLLRVQALPDGVLPMADTITRQLLPLPALTLKEGGLFQPSAHPDLAACQQAVTDQQAWLTQYEEAERERSGLKGLKIQSNGAFGYFIEIPRVQARLAPDDYTRKQTLTNAERFTTPALKHAEQQLQEAHDRLVQLEMELFLQLRLTLLPMAGMLKDVAQRVAALDVIASYAYQANRWGYVRPRLHDHSQLTLINARHPVLEQHLPQGRYVANHANLDASGANAPQLLLITGPNMAGKSTYMRTVALVVLMAQVGSFVPAEAADIGLVDAIYTRVGAVDDLTTGQSTFMVEMQETAAILHNATNRSLVLLDEVGRGTSTYDGISIAWSVVEHLVQNNRCRTLFATHYHELNALEQRWPAVCNVRVCVAESDNGIVFLHRVEPGTAQKSYGLHVAKMAGLPKSLLLRADSLLNQLQRREVGVKTKALPVDADAIPQLPLFTL
jgi:DNA mismatch repair protein MutS